MLVDIIDSKTVLPEFDFHIKVSAGPGAGKTKWLINHIRNVLNNSKNLGISRKIACITYTNVAVETIIKRLGDGASQVEVSTIHSFLYKHVLSPYVHFLPSEYEIDASKIDGHDDVIITGYQFLKDWKAKTRQERITDNNVIVDAFENLRWSFDNDGSLITRPRFPVKFGNYSISNDSYFVYKKMAWARGVIHHDDVLFLSFEIIRLFPFVLQVLRAKFPYFFIDEFQDISPIQLHILNLIIQKDTHTCIVGDSAQSIYKFMGAIPGQFNSFTAPGLKEYRIEDNWRSTVRIVDLLNLTRTDLKQEAMRKIVGANPVIIVGDKISALSQMKTETQSNEICTLARDNILANSVRKGINNTPGEDSSDLFSALDSNRDRKRAIIRCVKAIEFSEQGYYKDALKETGKMHDVIDKNLSKKKSLEILKKLINGKKEFVNGSLMDLYNFIVSNYLAVLAKPTKKELKEFLNSTSYVNFSIGIKALNESLPFKTIHKSKGDEFDGVLIVIAPDKKGNYDENKSLSFLLSPDLTNEEHRIKYVAMSRAMNHLYINIPELNQATEARLIDIGFVIK